MREGFGHRPHPPRSPHPHPRSRLECPQRPRPRIPVAHPKTPSGQGEGQPRSRRSYCWFRQTCSPRSPHLPCSLRRPRSARPRQRVRSEWRAPRGGKRARPLSPRGVPRRGKSARRTPAARCIPPCGPAACARSSRRPVAPSPTDWRRRKQARGPTPPSRPPHRRRRRRRRRHWSFEWCPCPWQELPFAVSRGAKSREAFVDWNLASALARTPHPLSSLLETLRRPFFQRSRRSTANSLAVGATSASSAPSASSVASRGPPKASRPRPPSWSGRKARVSRPTRHFLVHTLGRRAACTRALLPPHELCAFSPWP